MEVNIEVYTYLDQADHKDENLAHEQRRHWDMRELDEYIIANECSRSYILTPEQIVCRKETLAEIMAVLNSCTKAQRERFLLYALEDMSFVEINYAQKRLYHKAYFSLDCEDGIENDAIGWAQPSPEDYMIEWEGQAAHELLLEHL